MSKFVIYTLGSDGFLGTNGEPFVGTKQEVEYVVRNEVVNPKNYEIKPRSFLAQWAKRQEKLEEAKAKIPYNFSPLEAEYGYTPPATQARFLLIVGEEGKRKSGHLVKAFNNIKAAAVFAASSMSKLQKEFPNLGYFIYDTGKGCYIGA